MYQQGDPAYRNQSWIDSNVKNGHGALGAQYPEAGRISGVKEGDTPSFLYLLTAGLSDPEHPHWGCWGGRFEKYGDGTNFYIDAQDDHPSASGSAAQKQWTVGRWSGQVNKDFAARMDWCVKDYASANHNPTAHLNGDDGIEVMKTTVKPGQIVKLSAAGSSDPDGDDLTYHWWQYQQAGSYKGKVKISGANSKSAAFKAPSVSIPATVHIILEVTDNWVPNLTGYRRSVVRVDPMGIP
jgi:hypothetical protein